MFYGQCNDCGERWELGTAPTCKCPVEALAKPDFWEGYVPEPVKPATEESSATQAQQALDKKAENARELGLDYEPAQPYKSIAAHINQATNSGVRIDPVTGDVGIGTPSTPAQQEPVACSVCDQVHSILDGDASKIIRNAQDGYPDGRSSRILTLQERVMALCRYASDWKRWCLEKESTSPPAQRTWVGLTDEEIKLVMDGCGEEGDDDYVKPAFDPFGISEDDLMNFARAIEAKLKEKNNG